MHGRVKYFERRPNVSLKRKLCYKFAKEMEQAVVRELLVALMKANEFWYPKKLADGSYYDQLVSTKPWEGTSSRRPTMPESYWKAQVAQHAPEVGSTSTSGAASQTHRRPRTENPKAETKPNPFTREHSLSSRQRGVVDGVPYEIVRSVDLRGFPDTFMAMTEEFNPVPNNGSVPLSLPTNEQSRGETPRKIPGAFLIEDESPAFPEGLLSPTMLISAAEIEAKNIGATINVTTLKAQIAAIPNMRMPSRVVFDAINSKSDQAKHIFVSEPSRADLEFAMMVEEAMNNPVRPISEPPIFDYGWMYEQELHRKEVFDYLEIFDSIEAKTEWEDDEIELQLLNMYSQWAGDQRKQVVGSGRYKKNQSDFYRFLSASIMKETWPLLDKHDYVRQVVMGSLRKVSATYKRVSGVIATNSARRG